MSSVSNVNDLNSDDVTGGAALRQPRRCQQQPRTRAFLPGRCRLEQGILAVTAGQQKNVVVPHEPNVGALGSRLRRRCGGRVR
jgi:hypothetical protein